MESRNKEEAVEEDFQDETSIHIEEDLTSSGLTQPDTDDHDEDPNADTPTRRSRVRFRSRVRIASSHHRSRRRLSATSSLSSTVSSRSSSVSAPLRSPPTAENCSPGWGTLGTRVALLAYANRANQSGAQSRTSRRKGRPSETSPLLAPPAYDDDESSHSDDDDYDDGVRLARQVDAVFGPWPARLMNRHWWWWQLHPMLCCFSCCLDESDYGDT